MALSMLLLLPLIFGMIDFGYYFFVATTASEAARVGARYASRSSVGTCASAAATTMTTNAQNEVTTYMTRAGLGTSVVTTTALATCTTVGTLSPAWQLEVTIDFAPPIGFLRSLMKQSTTPGKVRYYQKVVLLGS